MKYYIIAGEASGDLHGSNLMKALKQEDELAKFRVWGGNQMQAAGGDLVKHYRDLAFMGVVEVIKKLPTIRRNFRFCESDILTYQPDVLILIDYSGFNLRIAKWAKAQQITVFYYIAPQVWASRSSRVEKIKRYVDRLFVILPFEKDFYKKYNYEVDFVGHPLLDVVKASEQDLQFRTKYQLSKRDIIALLPGSRQQEIRAMLPTMLAVAKRFPNYQFVVAGAPSQTVEFYHSFFNNQTNVTLIQNATYPLLQEAKAALVTSGTATLEAALFRVPQVVCYKGNPFFYAIASRIIKVKYIALVNLIMEKELVKELIQGDFNEENLFEELDKLLNTNEVAPILAGYKDLRKRLGEKGASERTAKKMLEYLTTV